MALAGAADAAVPAPAAMASDVLAATAVASTAISPRFLAGGSTGIGKAIVLETELSPLLVADRNCRSAGRMMLSARMKALGALSWSLTGLSVPEPAYQ